jgi:hypothetical protein
LIDPSILKTERPPVTCARSNSYCGRRNRPTAPPALPAEAGSFIDPKETSATKAKVRIPIVVGAKRTHLPAAWMIRWHHRESY